MRMENVRVHKMMVGEKKSIHKQRFVARVPFSRASFQFVLDIQLIIQLDVVFYYEYNQMLLYWWLTAIWQNWKRFYGLIENWHVADIQYFFLGDRNQLILSNHDKNTSVAAPKTAFIHSSNKDAVAGFPIRAYLGFQDDQHKPLKYGYSAIPNSPITHFSFYKSIILYVEGFCNLIFTTNWGFPHS